MHLRPCACRHNLHRSRARAKWRQGGLRPDEKIKLSVRRSGSKGDGESGKRFWAVGFLSFRFLSVFVHHGTHTHNLAVKGHDDFILYRLLNVSLACPSTKHAVAPPFSLVALHIPSAPLFPKNDT